MFNVIPGGREDEGTWVRDISLSLISAVNAGDRTILVPSHLRSHLLSRAKVRLCSDVNPVMSSYIRMHPHLACNIFKRCKNAIEVP